MDFSEITKPRFGQECDPCWEKYHRWTKDSYPIRLPACIIESSQHDLGTNSSGIVRWTIERGVPIVVRLDDSTSHVLVEILPEGKLKPTAGASFLERTDVLTEGQLGGEIGIGFEWVFDVVLKPPGQYQPAKALGLVMMPGGDLLGKETSITVRKFDRPRQSHKEIGETREAENSSLQGGSGTAESNR